MSATARETLDRVPWEEAMQKGGTTLVYRGVKFFTEEVILRWVAAKGSHIPQRGPQRGLPEVHVLEGRGG